MARSGTRSCWTRRPRAASPAARTTPTPTSSRYTQDRLVILHVRAQAQLVFFTLRPPSTNVQLSRLLYTYYGEAVFQVNRTGRSSARAQTQFVFSAIQPRPCMRSEIVWYTTYPGHDGNNKIWNFLRKGMCSCEKCHLQKINYSFFLLKKCNFKNFGCNNFSVEKMWLFKFLD